MRIRRRWIIGSVLGLGALSAVAVGVAVAAPVGDGERPRDKIIERAASILGIETDRLDKAIQQAQADLEKERRDEQLQKLVEDGVITQGEADQIKAWLNSMPDAVKKLPGYQKHQLQPGPHPLPMPPAPDTFLLPKVGPLPPDLAALVDKLVEDGVITKEQAEQMRQLWQEGMHDGVDGPQIRPFRGEPFEHGFRFHDGRPFGPGFPRELPFKSTPTPKATPAPGT